MDAIDTILKAHDLLSELCSSSGFRDCLYDLYNVSKELDRLNHNRERLITITNRYDQQTAIELRLLDRYFLHPKQGVYVLEIEEEDRTIEFPFCPYFDNLTKDIIESIIPIERLRQIVLTSISICASLNIIVYDLRTMYSEAKNSDKQHNNITPNTSVNLENVKPFSEYLSEHGRKHEDEIIRLLTPILNGAKGALSTTCLNLLIWYGYMDNYSDDKGRPKLRALAPTLNNEFNTQLSRTSLKGIIRKGDIIVTKSKKSASRNVIDKISAANYKSRDISELIIYLMQNALPEWKQVPKSI